MIGGILCMSLFSNIVQGFHAARNSRKAGKHAEKLQALQKAEAEKRWEESAKLQRELHDLTIRANRENLEKQLKAQRDIFEDQARLATWPLNNSAPATNTEFERQLQDGKIPELQIFVIHDGTVRSQTSLNKAIENEEREVEALFTTLPRPCVHTTNILKKPTDPIGTAAVNLIYDVYKLAPCLLIVMAWVNEKLRFDFYTWDSLGDKVKIPSVDWDVLGLQKQKLRDAIASDKYREAFGEEIVKAIESAIEIEDNAIRKAAGDSDLLFAYKTDIADAYAKVFARPKVSGYLDAVIKEELKWALRLPIMMLTDAYHLSSSSILPNFPKYAKKVSNGGVRKDNFDTLFGLAGNELPRSQRLKVCALLAKSFADQGMKECEEYYLEESGRIVEEIGIADSHGAEIWSENKDIPKALEILGEIQPDRYTSLYEKFIVAKDRPKQAEEEELPLKISLEPRMKCEVLRKIPQSPEWTFPAIRIKNGSEKSYKGLRVTIINGETGESRERVISIPKKEAICVDDVAFLGNNPKSFEVVINHSSGMKKECFREGWQETGYPVAPQIKVYCVRCSWAIAGKNPVIRNTGNTDVFVELWRLQRRAKGNPYKIRAGKEYEFGYSEWKHSLDKNEPFWIKINGITISCVIRS